MFLVNITKNKTDCPKAFTISDEPYFTIVQKYIEMRPDSMDTNRFFLSYRNGRVIRQVIGKNIISATPKKIATFLKLPNPEKYTGIILYCTNLNDKYIIFALLFSDLFNRP